MILFYCLYAINIKKEKVLMEFKNWDREEKGKKNKRGEAKKKAEIY